MHPSAEIRSSEVRTSSGRRNRRWPVCLALALVAATIVSPTHPGATEPGGHQISGRPNIVLILTDDQRWDTLWSMPVVQSELVSKGITFSNAFVVNALCCPSRSTILTGRYSHTTGVYRNAGRYGGFAAFKDGSTTGTWLQGAGYRTAFMGKYLNGYLDAPYVPPGWDRWVVFSSQINDDPGNSGGGYYDYTLSIDGTPETHGSDPSDYSTDVLATRALDFISSTPQDQPFFLSFAPRAPHDPATPAHRDLHAFPNLPPWRPPSYNEADVSDKPAYVRDRPPLTSGHRAQMDRFRQDQYRSLLAVDRAVGAILEGLTLTGRLSNTLIMFASDNGLMWGEHRFPPFKMLPYEESIRIPLVIRYDALVQAPRVDDHLVANIDFAPTFADAGGAGLGLGDTDGRSLLPLVAGPSPPWRSNFLVEHVLGSEGFPSYCAERAAQFLYVAYQTKEEELYDLRTDPYELKNAINDAAYAPVLNRMRVRLKQLCSPPPPGFKP